jgi:radical SAM superfamily enzyme
MDQQMEKKVEMMATKLESTIETLQSMLYSQSYVELLDPLNTVIAQYESLRVEFETIVVFAHILPKTDPDVVPRVLLRTKLDDQDQVVVSLGEDSVTEQVEEEIKMYEFMIEQTKQYQQSCIDILSDICDEVGMEPVAQVQEMEQDELDSFFNQTNSFSYHPPPPPTA